MTINDGGPAYPVPADAQDHEIGMSKREVYATRALPAAIQETGSISHKRMQELGFETWEGAAAAMAFRFADAMVRASAIDPEAAPVAEEKYDVDA